MGLRSRVRSWRRHRRWNRSARDTADLLREFVYLDEVSVYSLIASKDGMIATELTDTQASSLRSEASSSLGGSAGVARAGVAATIETNETNSTQLLRKAVVQSTFRDLHNRIATELVIGPPAKGDTAPRIGATSDLRQLVGRGVWVIDPSTLARGQMIELSVTLEAEPLFQARTMMSVVLEMILDDPQQFGNTDLGSLTQAAFASQMLDKLLVGLVPLHCLATDYVVVEAADRQELLVHREVSSQVAGVPSKPLSLVGVAEQGLFWKDLRRVVFSGDAHTVLARIGRNGLQSTWSSLKLVDVLEAITPGMQAAVEQMNRTILPTTTDMDQPALSITTGLQVAPRETLVKYALLLAENVGAAVSESNLDQAGLLDIADQLNRDTPIATWRLAFSPIAEYVDALTDKQINPEVGSHLRMLALSEAGFGHVPAATVASPNNDSASGSDERLIDAEIIAIYW